MVVASGSNEAGGKHLHPTYKEMILTAVSSMKERGGSSRRAISKFISTKYTDLSSKHEALLLCHLRRLHSKGALLRLKNSYKLKPSLNLSSLADLMPRPPGRPKKVRPRGRPRTDGVAVLNGKRKPGRPKKEKKGPGRPKKENGVVKKLSEKKKGPGRPKKEAGGAVQEVLEKKKSPGRPKKVKKSPGRPKKDVKASQDTLEKKESEGGQPKEKKKAGRPRKEKEFEALLELEGEKKEKEADASLELEGEKKEKEAEASPDGDKKEKEVQQVGEKKRGPGRPKKEVK